MKQWIVVATAVACGAAFCQEPAAKLSFEVVSIKPAAAQAPNQVRMMRGGDPGRARFAGFSLRDYIRIAYRVKDFQVEGPAWIDSDRFDVEGKLPEGASESQEPEMLQTMLEERFGLKLHRETKDHAIFALVPAKGGAKLKPTEAKAMAGLPGLDGPPPARGGRGGLPRNAMMIQMDDQGAHVKAAGVTLGQLSEMLSRFTERPVIDMTKIDGQYDFDLVLSPEALRAARGSGGGMMLTGPPPGAGGGAPGAGAASGGGESGRPADAQMSGGTIQEAVERYGLKLEPRKAAMEILVVDHIEKAPVEN